MKNLIRLFLVINLLTSYCSYSQVNDAIRLEKSETFFPGDKKINQDNIEFKYLIVPENWNNPSGKKIKIAVAVLKSNSKSTNPNPVVFLAGGPGAEGMIGIRYWASHPLRKESDLVLLDTRGTGNSHPKFCPDLGNSFLEILAKNQNSEEDELDKITAAMACKQDLINRGIDLKAYNSKAIAKDLNALKTMLKYRNWNVYGVSYGTYTAQVYANDFPEDIKTLILDSSIPDITNNYYNTTTSKYINSLNKVFKKCQENPDCNEKYPNLESTYYQTIQQIKKKPITVKVNKQTISSGVFTYNVQDFKVCIQQALYQRNLIEVIPLLITSFYQEDKSTLSALVAAFSGALSLDYGIFYTVACNEALPFNSIAQFKKDASSYKKLSGGLSFYRSDFKVCDKWNLGMDSPIVEVNDLSKLSMLDIPILVYSGEFDPVTPPSYGKLMIDKFKNSYLVNAPASGHCPGFSEVGGEIISAFVVNPASSPNLKELQADNKISFVTNVNKNGGVSSLGNSLNEFDLIFFAPFLIAVIILLVSAFNLCYVLIRNKTDNIHNKLIRGLTLITALLGLFTIVGLVLAINDTAQRNFFILAFGLPEQFGYLFDLQWVFVALILLSLLYFIFKIRVLTDRSVKLTVLFSLVLIGVYFQYWGFLF